MKKSVIILIILLASFVSAQEDYSVYESLKTNLILNTYLNIEYGGSGSRLSELHADLDYFPRNDERQFVERMDVYVSPSGKHNVGEEIAFEWNNIHEPEIMISLDSDIQTFNLMDEVKKKIHFPLQSLEGFDDYLQDSGKIDLTYEVEAKANEIVKGEDDMYVVVFKLGKWVKDNIEYNLTSTTAEAVQSSSWVLDNKQGVCDELTNLFISFCRSVGIPARFVSGVAYTNLNGDFGGHGWAEVYFPDYGWIPFDVTYGQFGWIDVSHIKLQESIDSGESSIAYNWRAFDVQVKANDVDIEVDLIKPYGFIDQKVKLDVDALVDEVDFDSAIPVEVTVKNLEDYYLPVSVHAVQAPSELNKNVEHILLKPGEEKKVYWIIKTPEDLEKGYIYTADFVVNSSFGGSDFDLVKYGENYEYYSLAKAQEDVARFENIEEKIVFENLDLDCEPIKDSYYSNESVELKCLIENKGNVLIDHFEVCVRNDCKEFSNFGISKQKEFSFIFKLKASKDVDVVAQNNDFVKVSKVPIEVIRIPELNIVNFKPKNISYKENGILSFVLVSDILVENVHLDISKIGALNISYIDGSHKIEVPVKGSDLNEGVIISLDYTSQGKEFSKEEEFYVRVYDRPILVVIIDWFKGLI